MVQGTTQLTIPHRKQPPNYQRIHKPPHTNPPTQTHLDYHQPLTPSYAVQLCSFPRLTAALSLWKSFTVTRFLQ